MTESEANLAILAIVLLAVLSLFVQAVTMRIAVSTFNRMMGHVRQTESIAVAPSYSKSGLAASSPGKVVAFRPKSEGIAVPGYAKALGIAFFEHFVFVAMLVPAFYFMSAGESPSIKVARAVAALLVISGIVIAIGIYERKSWLPLPTWGRAALTYLWEVAVLSLMWLLVGIAICAGDLISYRP